MVLWVAISMMALQNTKETTFDLGWVCLLARISSTEGTSKARNPQSLKPELQRKPEAAGVASPESAALRSEKLRYRPRSFPIPS